MVVVLCPSSQQHYYQNEKKKNVPWSSIIDTKPRAHPQAVSIGAGHVMQSCVVKPWGGKTYL